MIGEAEVEEWVLHNRHWFELEGVVVQGRLAG